MATPAETRRGGKPRLDEILVARGLAESRSRAQALIMAGLVFSRGRRLEKPGQRLAPDAPIEVKGRDHPWVSRGGVKLAHALDHFGVDPKGLVCLDIGASTGGFTQVLLERGAAHVVAIDVGHGQLHECLRGEPRLTSREGRDARSLVAADLPGSPGAIVADVSFISLILVLAPVLPLAAQDCWLIALIKPQFELEPEAVGKGGIVRSAADRRRAVDKVRGWLSRQPGWRVDGVVPSPIAGKGGNEEFLIGARRDG
jgi:23S rRNA (cytidine1920-2'-O)/16S rRNA (cytidine1409-2'-O)-methyltransferase